MNICVPSIAAIKIERVFRGHCSRKTARKMRRNKDNSKNMALFNFFALLLQKSFRGFYSRKYRQNHARRQSYIKDVIERGDEIREMLKQYSINQELVSIS